MNKSSDLPKRIVIWEMINPFIFFMLCLVMCILSAYLIAFAINSLFFSRDILLQNFLAESSVWCYLFFYLAALVIKGGKKSRAYESIKYKHELNSWPVIKCVVAVIVCFFAALAISAILSVSWMRDAARIYDTAAEATFAGKSPVLLIITAVIAGPMAEEMIFRYMIFGRMRFYIGDKWAILLSSLLFGLYHLNLMQFVYCSLLGVIFSFIYDKSGNIWIPITAHMAINFVGIAVYF